MALHSKGLGADPLTRGLLDRLRTPRPGCAADPAGGDATRQPGLLPEVSDSALLALLGSYHRRGSWVGFPELTADRT